MKTYLVTGGAGFIGSNYITYLLKNIPEIKVINVDALTYAGNLENLKSVEHDPRYQFVHADICDREAIAALFEQYSIDVVVNFAAETHVDRSIQSPDAFIRTNIQGTVNLLDNARISWGIGEDTYREGVKFLQVSTDEVYGTLGAQGYFTEDTPLDPHSPYSASKASADLLVKAYADTYGLPINITRCSNNYGPYQFPEKLVPLMIYNALHHKALPIYGDGLQVRDWLYVEDHCAAIELVIEKGQAGQVYNIGGHNEKTNLEIVKTILGYLEEHADPTINESLMTYVTDRKGHDRRYAIDPKKIGESLGWQPSTCFEDGIVKTIDWYRSQSEWLERVTSGVYQDYYQTMYGGR